MTFSIDKFVLVDFKSDEVTQHVRPFEREGNEQTLALFLLGFVSSSCQFDVYRIYYEVVKVDIVARHTYSVE